MKRKIGKIWGVGLTVVIAASLILWTAPVSAGTLSWGSEDLPDELEVCDVLDIAVSADGGVIYAVGGFVLETTGTEGTGDEARIVIDASAVGIETLGDIDSISWYEYLVAGYPPHVDIILDMGGGVTDALVIEYAYNFTSHYTDEAPMPYGALTGEWYQTFSDDGAGPTVINGDANAWLTTGASGPLDQAIEDVIDYGDVTNATFVYGTLTSWVAGTEVTEINANTPVLRLEIEVDNWVVQSEAYVADITVNDTTYAAGLIYRSTNGGESWSTLAKPNGTVGASLVAVTPDDENYIAVVVNVTEVWVSDDAGATWDSLTTATPGLTLNVINDLAISAAKGGYHYVAVAGEDVNDAACPGQIWYYKVGGVGSVWKEASAEEGFDDVAERNEDFAGAVAFSPNFASDEVMVAITADAIDAPDASAVLFQIFSFDQTKWNEKAGFDGYPVDLTQDTPGEITSLDSASIALSPDYLGSDDSMRLAFVGITVNGSEDADETSGIQRIEDDDNDVIKDDVHINSVAYDGTDLVAGKYDSTTVYRCADPLASSPSAKGSAGLKSPGGDDKVVVAFAGNKVVAGTSGDESAFAVSGDEGKTFNDISLIDTTLATLSDVAVSPDGSNVYLVTDDGSDLSLWRYASAWERVLAVDDKTGFIVRLAPDDADVVFVADAGGDARTIYYSAKGGDVKWFTRISTEPIVDMAVEGDGSVVYVATGGYVSKSTNGGFTWGSKKSSKLSVISMIVSLGEDLLLAGSKDGKAAYTTDGNSSWSKLSGGMPSTGVVQVIAGGLEDGDFVYAVTNAESGDDFIYRWELGEDDDWGDICTLPTKPTGKTYECSGIALQDGVLYALAAGAAVEGEDEDEDISMLYRSLNPTSDDPSWNTADSAEELFTVTPSALRVSVSDTTIKLWAIDSPGALFSYKDTLAAVAPTLLGPADGFINKMNPISGAAFDITFSWERPSKKVTAYDFVIALDSDFNEVVLDQVRVKSSSKVGVVAGPTGTKVGEIDFAVEYMPDTTYYWRVRVDEDNGDGPIRSPWSEVRSFEIEEAPVPEPVIVAPTPEITVSVPPAPTVVLPAPEIIIPTPEIVLPAPQVTLPPTPAPVSPIPAWALYLIIIIGAVLVIALIVLILRTRRPV